MMKKGIYTILSLTAIAFIVFTAGCTAPAQKNTDMLYGKDVFNPLTFSMAKYSVNNGSGQNAGELIVLSSPGEKDGNRLSSIAVSDYGSSRMDVWLGKGAESINKATLAIVDNTGVKVAALPPAFNATTMDQTWNSPGSRYTYYGSGNATVPAGVYENCSIYYGSKSVMFNGSSLDVSVLYYMHPSSPVPVLYLVKTQEGVMAYELQSVYRPGDADSSPEMAIQTYFDRLGAGDYTHAARLLLRTDGLGLKPMDKASIEGMSNNMSQTYGENGEKTAIQYVVTDSISPIGTIDGYAAVVAHWKSIQYGRSDGQVYIVDHSFNMVDDNGWKIIV